MSMTLEELKEKARLTPTEIENAIWKCDKELYGTSDIEMLHPDGAWINMIPEDARLRAFNRAIAKAQQDKDWQTFIQFCEENNIEQVSYSSDGGYFFKSVKEVLRNDEQTN